MDTLFFVGNSSTGTWYNVTIEAWLVPEIGSHGAEEGKRRFLLQDSLSVHMLKNPKDQGHVSSFRAETDFHNTLVDSAETVAKFIRRKTKERSYWLRDPKQVTKADYIRYRRVLVALINKSLSNPYLPA
jgi:hypothetical protein